MSLKKLLVWSHIAAHLAKNPLKLRASFDDFQFLSDRETLKFLMENEVGIIRYGDGELNFTVGYPAIHQKQNRVLRKKLRNILKDYNKPEKFILTLPLDLLLKGNFEERNSPKENWHAPKYAALPLLKKNAFYGSALCFRLKKSLDDDTKERAKEFLEFLKKKDIIYVGGGESYKAFVSPVSVIKIPDRDAFSDYKAIMGKIEKAYRSVSAGDVLVIISGGVTATALSADLNNKDILTYDIGSFFHHLKTIL